MLNHNYLIYIFVFSSASSHDAKSACQPKRLAHGLRFCECKGNKYQTDYQINQPKMFFHTETIA